MIRDMVNLSHTLSMFENVLKINPNCQNIQDQVVISRKAIENEIYMNIPEGKTIYDISGDRVDDFLGSVTECLKHFTLLTVLESWDLQFGQTLKAINYIGEGRMEVVNSFRLLVRKDLQYKRSQFFEELINAFSSIQSGELRRIVCIMAVFENIGMLDAMAIMAAHIVLGGRS